MLRRALIVDDEPAICELIKKVLDSAGLESLTLSRSAEAPAIIEEGKFDMIFLDLHMSSPDGIELARQVRRTESNRITPIILVSDDQRPSAMSIGFEAGASFFLYKPIHKDRLLKLARATQGSMEAGRRRTRRVPLKSSVSLRFGLEDVDGETVDVSPAGLLVKAQRIFPAGSSVGISLRLSGRLKPILCKGSVVRIGGGNQMGIHLDRMNSIENERLQEFLLPLINSN
jgi:DNA-binding response OmpR family regulator